MELEMEDFVLSDSGAAGAFIHGLEDEFFEVRSISECRPESMLITRNSGANGSRGFYLRAELALTSLGLACAGVSGGYVQ